ncbi:major facilitator superfamily domain-containing protein 8-like [Palaemon carinicauda]|uniref:major facilitator superfamily domain-containing protein 8-like n=1 Tax=Palaemon carinicauda TaxID=392227 RepID=UPI0035B59823
MMEEKETPTLLETLEEKRARRRSHYVVYFTTFIGSVGFSIILTGVWPYLQQLDSSVSKEFLGWVIAANPLGQMLASPILGLWANKARSSRGALLFAIAIFIVGNALYSILSIFGASSRALMVFARFLVGVSFANMAVIRSYVAASTTTDERTSAVALTSAAQGGGFIIGPAIQAAIAVAFSQEIIPVSNSTTNYNATDYLDEVEEVSHLEWNMYTAAGWAAAVLGIINFFTFFPCIFQEYPVAAKEAQMQRSAANANETEFPNPDYKTVVAILVSFFITQFVFVLIEVVLVPMCMDMYAWSDEIALTVIGIGLCVAGIVATIMFASVGALVRRFDERKVYIFLGLVPLLISMACFIPMGNTYPKIQNCTLETGKLHHREARSISPMLPYHLGVVKNHMYPMIYVTKPLNSSQEEEYSLKPLVGEMSISFVDVPFSYEIDDHQYTGTLEEEHIVTRRRRGIRREKKCRDTGCPPEQEWCKYTPIIEQSQMIVACFLSFVGYPIAFTLSSSLYSKLLGPNPQGLWMGILTSIGSFSRMTGPIFVSYMYTELGTRWTFGLLVIVMMIVIFLTLAFYKRLVPMKLVSS